MFNLFKPAITVEQIHAEIDSAEEESIKQINEFLAVNKIETESQLKRKANLMKDLGFKSSETVKRYEVFEENQRDQKSQIDERKTRLNSIMDLKSKYPLDKFLDKDVFLSICKKYKLIHAPASNYIKDVPEKNLLEMKNRKPLAGSDTANTVTIWRYKGAFSQEGKAKLTKDEMVQIREGIDISKYRAKTYHWNARNSNIVQHHFGVKEALLYDYSESEFEEIKMEGIMIAAPKSHFDLSNVKGVTKEGFFNVTITEIKDPIAFEFCKDNIVRIISKWGTDDDQSYLDPALTNEIQN